VIHVKIFYGRIHRVQEDGRIVTVHVKNRLRRLYFQRSLFTRFLKYLQPGNYLVAELKQETRKRSTVHTIRKIVQTTARGSYVVFSQRNLREETKKFVNSLTHKLFLDFEMSMHPYHPDKDFVQEIIQVGYVLTDHEENVLETFEAFVRPSRHKELTKRTKRFLKIDQKTVDSGMSFSEFYTRFQALLKTYKPAIIVWGKNDFLALKDAYRIHNLKPLWQESRFVNLLRLHKNYFNLKDDLGLLSAYRYYGHNRENQRHNALEDAKMTQRIFEGFKALINEEHPPHVFVKPSN